MEFTASKAVSKTKWAILSEHTSNFDQIPQKPTFESGSGQKSRHLHQKKRFLDKKSGGCQLLSRGYPEISGFFPRKRSPSPRKRSQEGSPASPGEAGRGRGTGQKDTLDERCPVWCIPPNPERSKIDEPVKKKRKPVFRENQSPFINTPEGGIRYGNTGKFIQISGLVPGWMEKGPS